MKVLHLTGDREDLGGILTVIRNLQSATKPWGMAHTVWVGPEYRELREPTLTYWRSRFPAEDVDHPGQLALRAARSFFELQRLLRQQSFDVLHAHSRASLLIVLALARRFSRSVVYTNHNYARRTGLYRWAAHQRGLHTVLLTPNMGSYYGIDVDSPRVRVISSCCADSLIDEPLVARVEQRRPLRLVGVGSLVRWKGWHRVVEAMAQLSAEERSQLEFSLWGPTPEDAAARAYATELREQVRALKLERQFLFRGPSRSIVEPLRAADWLVHPTSNEPCGVALIEALALGLPAVVSASGGPADIVRNGETGLHFRPDHPAALAEALRALLRGVPELFSPLEIRRSILHRTATAVAQQYRTVYELSRAQ